MWFSIVLAAVVAVSVSAAPQSQRIVGGDLTTIDNYPFQAAMLRQQSVNWYQQSCGGTILNNRAILTAAHCFDLSRLIEDFRIRVGSTYANSGGVVHFVNNIIIHPNYHQLTADTDIAIVWVASTIAFNNQVQPGTIAGTNYNVADNSVVWAIGWGTIQFGGPLSEQLRHVQIWTVNQEICNQRYGGTITDNMLCSGWLDVGGRDQCQNDSGGPLIHNGVVIGICSFGSMCATPTHPGVNTRVSRFTTWIQANA